MKYLNALSLLLIMLGALTFFFPQGGHAVSADDFKAGRIIDDSIFFDKDSMSVAQIQNFLDSKMPSCDTNHAESSHWKDFGQPYICLKDYREDPTVEIKDCTDEEIQNHFGFGSGDSRYEAAKNYCWWKRGRTNLVGKTAGSNSKSAAQIIKEAAQEHRINPQVLLVTLQKEQSLLTDDYPWVGQYQKAMGYACPDTADCDPQFRGFYNQVHNAAWQLRRYVSYPEQYNHATGDNFVRYHPNSSCGGTTVNIQTSATAALYNYTPYQPNKASLDAYPLEGNSCSSYGNRNFWFKFNNWFGSTIGERKYTWSINSVELYADQARTEPIGINAYVEPGQTVYLTLEAKNTGNQVWQQTQLKLGTTDPRDRSSPFCNNNWLSCGRVTRMNEESVQPGEAATFEASLTAPEKNGEYRENFNLMAEGIAWFSGPGLTLDLNVEPSRDFAVYADSNKIHRLSNNRIGVYAGTKLHATVTVRNTTDQAWPVNKTKLSTSNPIDRSSVFNDESWLTNSRVSRLENGELAPGESDKFTFTLTAPDTPGNYTEDFGIVIEGQEWIEHDTATLEITVKEHPGDSLGVDQNLRQDEEIVSRNGLYRLIMQSDGNLVIYSPRRPIWSTGTHGTNAHRTIVQSDSNVVTYSKKGPVWASGTRNQAVNRLVMQNDGNLVVYGNGGAVWASGTHGKY